MDNESDFLKRIYARSADLAGRFQHVLLGPGDDCAAVRAGPGTEVLLLTVDQLVEGRHFAPGTSVDLIARKAIARSISDIAAMAGTPTWGLAAGVIPEGYEHADELFEALHRWAGHWGAPLVGGDIASSARGSPLVLSVTVGGMLGSGGRAVLRSGAKAGDEVWVTGKFGGSLESGRHLTFEPRVREAVWLSGALGDRLHAMIDVSDGLGRDAGRIAAASGVRVEIELMHVPPQAEVSDPMRALGDGEDYELCFTVGAGALDGVASAASGVALTRIGRVVAGRGCVAVDERGKVTEIGELGWDHAG